MIPTSRQQEKRVGSSKLVGKKKRAKSPAIIILAGWIARSYSGGFDRANTGIGIESEVPLKTGVPGTGTRELRI